MRVVIALLLAQVSLMVASARVAGDSWQRQAEWNTVWVAAAAAADDKVSIWTRHSRVMTTVSALLLVQAGIIVGLLIHRRRRLDIETALKQSEERYREVVESQSEMVCRYRADTTLTFVNEAYCRFFGRKREELLNQSFLKLIPEMRQPEVLATVRRLVEERRPVLAQHEVLLPDGSVGWMEWQDFPIMGEHDEIDELQGIGRDVTERWRAAQALAESERNLAHATKLALVGELTASIAHEINQPLGAILSNAEAGEIYLSRGELEEVRRILIDIRNDDRRASEVIRRVRALLGKHPTRVAVMKVNDLVSETLQLMVGEAQRRRVVVLPRLASGLPMIEGDAVQLQQALINLVLNGMDAMKDSPPPDRTIVVSTDRREDSMVQVSVEDRGHGISPVQLPRIFESFFTTKETGMGLGLALVRSIVEAHGGEISAENNTHGGATFNLHLPAYKEHTRGQAVASHECVS